MSDQDQRPPSEILALGRARAQARRAREWAEADRLRAEIEAAGWRVVDRGTEFTLRPAHPPDLEEAGRTRYGSSSSVPARWDDSPVGIASVVLGATDWPADLRRALAALRAHSPVGTQAVIVADGPSEAQAADLLAPDAPEGLLAPIGGQPVDVCWTSARLGHAAALNCGLRRAAAPLVIVLDASVEVGGDIVTPLAAALADARVAVCGEPGVVSGDLRHFVAAPAGDVDAIEGYCQAFRRDDARERGPLDEHFRFYRSLDLWWSLVLRDEGDGRPPRRAVALDLPLVRHEHRGWASLPEAERERLSRRNLYRIIDRFGRRRDLLLAPAPAQPSSTRS